MTNVPPPTFGASGFIAPSEAAILAGVEQDINAAFGGNLNPAKNTPQGQIASSLTAILGNVNDTFLYYTQQVDPAYAQGRMQDGIARIYFIERKPAQPTVVQCTCTGAYGVVIPVGAVAVDQSGNFYSCTQGGTIPPSGSIVLPFANQAMGPIACLAGTLTKIYRAIPGWDTINNAADGVLGVNVESRAAFELRRRLSVAQNSLGGIPGVRGAVMSVPGVVDAYVIDNALNTSITIQGYVVAPNSIYVGVVGGADADVARAIWSRKMPGCVYNGNTTVTVQDTNSGYVPPYPSYSVTFQRASNLQICFIVTILSSPQVPANALALVQQALAGAFIGADGGPSARVATKVLASRFYPTVAALGSWAQAITVKVGSINAPGAVFTGSILGTTLTVSSMSSGTVAVGQLLFDAAGFIPAGTQTQSQSGGTPGGAGTYVLNNSLNVGSTTIKAVAANLDEVATNLDQYPVVSANNIQVVLGS